MFGGFTPLCYHLPFPLFGWKIADGDEWVQQREATSHASLPALKEKPIIAVLDLNKLPQKE